MFAIPPDVLDLPTTNDILMVDNVTTKPYIDVKEATQILGLTKQGIHLILNNEERRKELLPSAYQTESGLWIMLRKDVERLRERRENSY